MVERRIGSAEVTGPSPVNSLLKAWDFLGFFFFVLHGLKMIIGHIREFLFIVLHGAAINFFYEITNLPQ